ncbi:MAG: zinc ribbon domain-containing protein [Oscillospiraceae bacterium]|nr:zinc ribbon domain-containing protein [Oscillospiraceae bacterium]
MICRNCGRNNPAGQVTCFSCGTLLGQDPTAAMPSVPTAPNAYTSPYPPPYMQQAFPVSATRSGSGLFASGGNRNIPGLIAAVIYALSVFPVYIYVSASIPLLGITQRGDEARLVQSYGGWAILGIAVLAAIVAYIGNNKALTGAGGLAVAHMIYKVITVENAVNKLRDQTVEALSKTEYASYLQISFGKGMGFWLLILSSIALLAVGIISWITEEPKLKF